MATSRNGHLPEDDAERDDEEHMAPRELTGSSLEAEEGGDLEALLIDLQRHQPFEPGREQAMTWAEDMGLASKLGLDMSSNLGRRAAELMHRQRQQDAQELQKYGIDKRAAEQGADRRIRRDMADVDRAERARQHDDLMDAEYGDHLMPPAEYGSVSVEEQGEEWGFIADNYGEGVARKLYGSRPGDGGDDDEPPVEEDDKDLPSPGETAEDR